MNFRTLAKPGRSMGPNDPFRASYEWQQESMEQMGMTNVENKMSTTLRHASNALQVDVNNMVNADIVSVETALKKKIESTEMIKSSLDAATADVDDEIDLLLQLRRALEAREQKISEKLAVATARIQTRRTRPGREMTLDEVEKSLRSHEGLLVSTVEKIKRALGLVDKEVMQLQTIASIMAADSKDKARAIRVDGSVLAVDSYGRPTSLPNLSPRGPDSKAKSPFSWSARSADNVASARHWLADSARLRKAVKHVLHNSKNTEHEVSRSLNSHMMGKLSETSAIKNALEAELANVKNETTRAFSNRSQLAAALAAQRSPLAQAKQRLELRVQLPTREHLADEVEAALMAEVAHLAAITAKLGEKVNLADKELASLTQTAMMLEANIADKEAAISVDEAVAMADGRISLPSPPPSSASFAWSAASMARDATMARIQDLERDLVVARQEREGMEATIRTVKANRLAPLSAY
jgi:hypothetical protein